MLGTVDYPIKTTSDASSRLVGSVPSSSDDDAFQAAALPLPRAWSHVQPIDAQRSESGEQRDVGIGQSQRLEDIERPHIQPSKSLPPSPNHESPGSFAPSMPSIQRPPIGTPIVRSFSSTAVPLRFRRPPHSPSSTRESPSAWTFDAMSSPSPTTSRPRHYRASSTDFRSSTEFRPLFLVERNRKVWQPDYAFPPLPSSHGSSPTPSSHGQSDLYTSAPESPAEAFCTPLEIPDQFDSSDVDEALEELSSQQTTPKAPRSPIFTPRFSLPPDSFHSSHVEAKSVDSDFGFPWNQPKSRKEGLLNSEPTYAVDPDNEIINTRDNDLVHVDETTSNALSLGHISPLEEVPVNPVKESAEDIDTLHLEKNLRPVEQGLSSPTTISPFLSSTSDEKAGLFHGTESLLQNNSSVTPANIPLPETDSNESLELDTEPGESGDFGNLITVRNRLEKPSIQELPGRQQLLALDDQRPDGSERETQYSIPELTGFALGDPDPSPETFALKEEVMASTEFASQTATDLHGSTPQEPGDDLQQSSFSAQDGETKPDIVVETPAAYSIDDRTLQAPTRDSDVQEAEEDADGIWPLLQKKTKKGKARDLKRSKSTNVQRSTSLSNASSGDRQTAVPSPLVDDIVDPSSGHVPTDELKHEPLVAPTPESPRAGTPQVDIDDDRMQNSKKKKKKKNKTRAGNIKGNNRNNLNDGTESRGASERESPLMKGQTPPKLDDDAADSKDLMLETGSDAVLVSTSKASIIEDQGRQTTAGIAESVVGLMHSMVPPSSSADETVEELTASVPGSWQVTAVPQTTATQPLEPDLVDTPDITHNVNDDPWPIPIHQDDWNESSTVRSKKANRKKSKQGKTESSEKSTTSLSHLAKCRPQTTSSSPDTSTTVNLPDSSKHGQLAPLDSSVPARDQSPPATHELYDQAHSNMRASESDYQLSTRSGAVEKPRLLLDQNSGLSYQDESLSRRESQSNISTGVVAGETDSGSAFDNEHVSGVSRLLVDPPTSHKQEESHTEGEEESDRGGEEELVRQAGSAERAVSGGTDDGNAFDTTQLVHVFEERTSTPATRPTEERGKESAVPEVTDTENTTKHNVITTPSRDSERPLTTRVRTESQESTTGTTNVQTYDHTKDQATHSTIRPTSDQTALSFTQDDGPSTASQFHEEVRNPMPSYDRQPVENILNKSRAYQAEVDAEDTINMTYSPEVVNAPGAEQLFQYLDPTDRHSTAIEEGLLTNRLEFPFPTQPEQDRSIESLDTRNDQVDGHYKESATGPNKPHPSPEGSGLNMTPLGDVKPQKEQVDEAGTSEAIEDPVFDNIVDTALGLFGFGDTNSVSRSVSGSQSQDGDDIMNDEKNEITVRSPSPTGPLSSWQSYGAGARSAKSASSSATPPRNFALPASKVVADPILEDYQHVMLARGAQEDRPLTSHGEHGLLSFNEQQIQGLEISRQQSESPKNTTTQLAGEIDNKDALGQLARTEPDPSILKVASRSFSEDAPEQTWRGTDPSHTSDTTKATSPLPSNYAPLKGSGRDRGERRSEMSESVKNVSIPSSPRAGCSSQTLTIW